MASLNLFDEVDIDYDPEIERRTLIILETAWELCFVELF